MQLNNYRVGIQAIQFSDYNQSRLHSYTIHVTRNRFFGPM